MDPKYYGTDIRIAKRIARKHGPDVERRRMKLEQMMERIESAQRRAVKKQVQAQQEGERIREMILAPIKAELQEQKRNVSSWAWSQMRKYTDKLIPNVKNPRDLGVAVRKMRSFSEIVLGLDKEEG